MFENLPDNLHKTDHDVLCECKRRLVLMTPSYVLEFVHRRNPWYADVVHSAPADDWIHT